mmetsp:Transcript_51927/g.151279  ORF Transcript_51927/g.151279 Transcript_51927/m.151279 type:complete len:201 (+) Transcript_51927:742-1344(+)
MISSGVCGLSRGVGSSVTSLATVSIQLEMPATCPLSVSAVADMASDMLMSTIGSDVTRCTKCSSRRSSLRHPGFFKGLSAELNPIPSTAARLLACAYAPSACKRMSGSDSNIPAINSAQPLSLFIKPHHALSDRISNFLPTSAYMKSCVPSRDRFFSAMYASGNRRKNMTYMTKAALQTSRVYVQWSLKASGAMKSAVPK